MEGSSRPRRGAAPTVGEVSAARSGLDRILEAGVADTALSAYVLAVLALGALVPLALVLILGAAPIAAMLVSAAVTVVETGSLTFLETTAGLRRCFARAIVLGALVAVAVLATFVAFRFYGDAGSLAWPLAVLHPLPRRDLRALSDSAVAARGS